MEFSLGTGSGRWFIDADGVFGLIYSHGDHATWVAFRSPVGDRSIKADHRMVAGGMGEEYQLTITPMIQCHKCGHAGWITNGTFSSAEQYV